MPVEPRVSAIRRPGQGLEQLEFRRHRGEDAALQQALVVFRLAIGVPDHSAADAECQRLRAVSTSAVRIATLNVASPLGAT